MGEIRNTYKTSGRKISREETIWETQGDNIKWTLEKCEDVDWIQVAQDSIKCQILVNIDMSLRVPLK